MAEDLIIDKNTSTEARYAQVLPQIEALVSVEKDLVANLGNIAAALKEAFGFLWVGFYLKKDNQLVLGPFQGPVACTRIALDKGVCGAAFSRGKTIVVHDVEQFPGHIACSSASKSEIVVPIFNTSGQAVGVLDIDSDELSTFGAVDEQYLADLAKIIAKLVE